MAPQNIPVKNYWAVSNMVTGKSLKSSSLQFGAIPFDEKYSKNKEKLLLVTSTQMFFKDGKKRSSESVSKTVTCRRL
jgi:hypothetical protein